MERHSGGTGGGAVRSRTGHGVLASALFVVAAMTASTGCMAPGHMMGGMMGGMMGTMPMKDSTHAMAMRDSATQATQATHASVIARADALVDRTERMMDVASPHSDAHAMPAEGGAGDPATAMPAQLHQLAISVRTLLRQMDSMQPPGASGAMPSDGRSDMTEVRLAAEALIAGLERTILAVERRRQVSASEHR